MQRRTKRLEKQNDINSSIQFTTNSNLKLHKLPIQNSNNDFITIYRRNNVNNFQKN